jgi:hypothetical protein
MVKVAFGEREGLTLLSKNRQIERWFRAAPKGCYAQFPVMNSLRGQRRSSPWIEKPEGLFNFT